MVTIILEVNIPEEVFDKFDPQNKVKTLLQDFVEADGVMYLKDLLEELDEETKNEESEKEPPHCLNC
ncbi:MAG: hypothetical protein ACRKGH_06510 [Dehalogenimonas sp.]